MIVGKSAQRLYKGLDVGSQVKLFGATWTVVGTFESSGTGRESELIADKQTLNSAYQRGNGEQSIWVVLDGPGAFRPSRMPSPRIRSCRSRCPRKRITGPNKHRTISSILKIVAYVVGGIMAVGAIFGALNTMYSAVSTRSREIATLRAIGFGPVPVVVSVFVEALLLALIGGAIGALIAWLMFNGHSVDTLGGGFGGQLIFDLDGDPGSGGARHHLGLRHRRGRRTVPRDSRREAAGGHGAAGGVTPIAAGGTRKPR